MTLVNEVYIVNEVNRIEMAATLLTSQLQLKPEVTLCEIAELHSLNA